MATDLENLQTAKSNLLAAMAANAGKPDYTINGQSVSWSSIWQRLGIINSQIAALEGPTELETEGQT